MKLDPIGIISNIMGRISEGEAPPGTVWHGANKAACSLPETGSKRRVCFRNRTDQELLLCWVDTNSQPHHFYSLSPWKHQLLRGGGKSDYVDSDDHVETSVEGHAFLIAMADDIQEVQTKKSLDGDGVCILGAYRLEQSKTEGANRERGVHLVEIIDNTQTSGFRMSNLLNCCRPQTKVPPQYTLKTRWGTIDPTPLDTTCKVYDKTTLGKSQWPVYLEPGWCDDCPNMKETFEKDLDHMASCLPPHAVELLKATTPIWINKSLQYGPQACPVSAKGMCFHPEPEWLVENGCHAEKAESVELYNCAEYLKTRSHWGMGGILIHEFSHAYHHKGCQDGYQNKVIKECWDAAMKEKLYESVQVHGSQGPTAKAYACTNQMEYFAELSTAFLGGTAEKEKEREALQNEGGFDWNPFSPKRKAENGGPDWNPFSPKRPKVNEEFNKWFPFHRKQIEEHDPRAYEMLQQIWKVPTN